MKRTKSTYLALVAVLLSPMAANADFIFDWEGQCTIGCVGTATAVITLTDAYVPGSVVGQTDGALFVSLDYSSSSFSFSISNAELDTTFFLFGIDPDLVGLSQIATDNSLGTDGFPFMNWLSDEWRAGLILESIDFGDSVTMTLRDVPEPGTLVLFGLGLAGIAARRRKKV